MKWDIRPRMGIGPLRFGMSPGEVARVLDLVHPISQRHAQQDGAISEFRAISLPVCEYVEDTLRTIDTNWNVADVLFEEHDLYNMQSRQVLQLLEQKNGGAKIGLGMIYFDNLCINTTGFFDKKTASFYDIQSEAQDERGIGGLRPGALDAVLQYFKPMSFL